MPSILFDNLMNLKIFNNRRIAIYYLNNLHPNSERFNIDKKDVIKKLIDSGFISASEVDGDIIKYFKTKLKDKPYVQKLAKEHFIHQPNSHTFSL